MTSSKVAPIDYRRLHQRRRAVFQPQRTDDLRPEATKNIGKTFVFQCSDYGNDGEPYPGQYRWFALAESESEEGREHGKLHPEFRGWVPDEDLR
jgi:hypothetical protein